mmetsp:Transcript_83603/g.245114  ORF Transcript_83603/g.245114 Transcript_83603/m.245114 type:complete len:205 (-) Transcript_83603:941-1555(-)
MKNGVLWSFAPSSRDSTPEARRNAHCRERCPRGSHRNLRPTQPSGTCTRQFEPCLESGPQISPSSVGKKRWPQSPLHTSWNSTVELPVAATRASYWGPVPFRGFSSFISFQSSHEPATKNGPFGSEGSSRCTGASGALGVTSALARTSATAIEPRRDTMSARGPWCPVRRSLPRASMRRPTKSSSTACGTLLFEALAPQVTIFS